MSRLDDSIGLDQVEKYIYFVAIPRHLDVNTSGAASMILARNISQICMSSERWPADAVTLSMTSSRSVAASAKSVTSTH